MDEDKRLEACMDKLGGVSRELIAEHGAKIARAALFTEAARLSADAASYQEASQLGWILWNGDDKGEQTSS